MKSLKNILAAFLILFVGLYCGFQIGLDAGKTLATTNAMVASSIGDDHAQSDYASTHCFVRSVPSGFEPSVGCYEYVLANLDDELARGRECGCR